MTSHYRMNLPGTYEFFSVEDAQRAADEGRLRPGTVVLVDGQCYLALYYDEEKRIVVVRGCDRGYCHYHAGTHLPPTVTAMLEDQCSPRGRKKKR